MRFGVNYTPRVGWFHSWLDLDHRAVARDMRQIASLGLDHVRVLPLWPVIQPHRTLIRPTALQDVRDVVDIAGEAGLDVNVDALQGHLSSFDFLPSWLTSWHERNMFTDPQVVASLADYVRELAAVCADRPNLLGVTVGNEVNQFAARPHPHPQEAGADQVSAWLEAMLGAAREGLGTGPRTGPRGSGRDAGPLVTHAEYDATWYDDRQPFTPAQAALLGDATVTHSWVFNGAAQLAGGLAPESVRHAQYLLHLSAAWHDEADRPLWLQEVGAPTNVVASGDVPAFIARTVAHAAEVPHLWGVTWWCSHDVSRDLGDFPALEYDLGLFTADGALKPAGRALAEAVERHSGCDRVEPPAHALVLNDADEATYRAACGPGGSFFAAWMAEARSTGLGPQVLLASRTADRELTGARGIGTWTRPEPEGSARIAVDHPAVQ